MSQERGRLQGIGHRPSRQAGRSPGFAPQDVQDRPQLNRYLAQSMWDECREFGPDGEVKQRSTFVKSYIVERHGDDRRPTEAQWRQAFKSVLPRRDDTLILLQDREESSLQGSVKALHA